MLAVLAFGVGALMAAATVPSAIMTLVVPRALPVRITRLVSPERGRCSGCAGRGPGASRPATWLVLTGTGYMLMFWSLGERPLRRALVLSGSSIYTLV